MNAARLVMRVDLMLRMGFPVATTIPLENWSGQVGRMPPQLNRPRDCCVCNSVANGEMTVLVTYLTIRASFFAARIVRATRIGGAAGGCVGPRAEAGWSRSSRRPGRCWAGPARAAPGRRRCMPRIQRRPQLRRQGADTSSGAMPPLGAQVSTDLPGALIRRVRSRMTAQSSLQSN